MSEPFTRPFYVTGGTLKPGEPSYVERRADTELYESLLVGELCYVLTARQMGKSSLMARTAKRLEEVSVASAIVDLTQVGSERGSQAEAQWYFGVANKIHQQLKLTEPLRSWWQERSDLSSVQRLSDFFRELVLPHFPGRVVIFVDEIDSTIGLPFADDFFAALRASFNARATEPDFERLTFVLLGVATPDQLIQDSTRTPFNIGKRIDLTDFTPDEAEALAPGLHANSTEAGRTLERILHWTGGHPYLTQTLCRAVREEDQAGTAEPTVDPRVQEIFLSAQAQREETNLKHARARLEKRGAEGRRLLQLYLRVRQGKPVVDQPTSPLFAQLKLAGVVKVTEEGRLAVRNRVYEAVFTSEWAKHAMPADRGRRLAEATLTASLLALGIWYPIFQPRPYEQAFQAAIEDDGYNGAIAAYNALRANPFSRSRATELMQQFWEQRSLSYALAGRRDESLLSYLQGLRVQESIRLRKRSQNLVGTDYDRLQSTLRHEEPIAEARYSPDGRFLWTRSSNPRITYRRDPRATPMPIAWQSLRWSWELHSDQPPAMTRPRIDLRGMGTFLGIQYFPGRPYAAFTSRILVLDTDLNTWHAFQRPPNQRTLFPLALGPDGHTLASGSFECSPQIWDGRTGQRGLKLQHHCPFLIAFSSDGKKIATSSDKEIQIWNAQTGEHLQSISTPPHASLAFSPDGRWLAADYSNTAVRIWNAQTGQLIAQTFQNQLDVTSIDFAPDGRFLVTASGKTARIWELAPLLLHHSASVSRQQPIYSSRLSPDGQIIVVSFNTNSLYFLDLKFRKFFQKPLDHLDKISTFEFNPTGRTLATGSADGTVRLWDVVTRKPLAHRDVSKEPISALAFSGQGETLAVASHDFSVQVWDISAGMTRKISTYHSEHGPILSLAFSPDSQTLAIAGEYIQLWSAKTGRRLSVPLRIQEEAKTIAFRPDGKGFFVATAHWLNTYSWNGQDVVPQNSQMLPGFWKGAFHFNSDCEGCLQVALEDKSNSFRLKTLQLDAPTDPPIEGDPKRLLEKWQKRLGMTFDAEMRPVPVLSSIDDIRKQSIGLGLGALRQD